MRSAYTGQLYQFRTKTQLSEGSYVAVNGPWDTFGVVVKSTHEPIPSLGESSFEVDHLGPYLNLIRGVKPRAGERPVANF